jgi:cyclase
VLTRRLVITLTLNEGSLYRTKLFRPDRLYTMNFVDMEMADEMVILDVTRPGGDSVRSWARAKEFQDSLFLPLSMGGGVCDMDRALWLMRECGADKIVVNTEAFRRPEFITQLAEKFGSQSIVVSIDSRDGFVYTEQGRMYTGRETVDWAVEAQQRGAGELYLMDIDRDGSLQGYNLDLLRAVSSRVTIPVIISGGCGAWSHMHDGFNAGADACSTSCIFHFTKTGMGAFKEKLTERGHRIRT